MLERLKYLFSKGIIKSDEYIRYYTEIINKSEKIKMFANKYNITRNVDILIKITTHMKEIIKVEVNILNRVINEVE